MKKIKTNINIKYISVNITKKMYQNSIKTLWYANVNYIEGIEYNPGEHYLLSILFQLQFI